MTDSWRFFADISRTAVYNSLSPTKTFTAGPKVGAARLISSSHDTRGKESSMFTDASPLRIGILGSDGTAHNERHGCGLWPAGNAAAITAAGATPVPLTLPTARPALEQLLNSLQGVVIAETET